MAFGSRNWKSRRDLVDAAMDAIVLNREQEV